MGKNQIHKQAEAQVHGGCNNIQRSYGESMGWPSVAELSKGSHEAIRRCWLRKHRGAQWSFRRTHNFLLQAFYLYLFLMDEHKTTTKKYTALVWYYDNDLLSQELREDDKIHGQKDRSLEL